MTKPDNTILLEGVRLAFRNFTGKPGKYNGVGERSFLVVMPESSYPQIPQMVEDGWNIKQFKHGEEEMEEGVEPGWFMPVVVKYRTNAGQPVRTPPKVVLVTSRGRRNLDEEEIGDLDSAEISNVDLIVRPYAWGPINGKFGISAYLKTIVVTVEEDALEIKYGEIPRQT